MKHFSRVFEFLIAVFVGASGGIFIYNVIPLLAHGVTPENKMAIIVGFFALFIFVFLLIQINHLKKKLK
jgi:divalent metal cation (Fe/Co/Zn/Cd) transporter